MHLRPLHCLAALALAGCAPSAFAQAAGHFTLGAGLYGIAPKSDAGTILAGTTPLEVDDGIGASLTWETFIAENWGLETALNLAGKQDITVDGSKAGSFVALPPSFTVQYHFNGSGNISPFVGLGLNYATYFSESGDGVLAGTDLKLKDSFGLAAHAGIDFAIGESGAVRVDVRWMQMRPDIALYEQKVGSLKIDPLYYGVAYIHYF
ncbi:outer membrane protein [Pseudoxanthomonas sp. GM95]|uniref:OmpW/AlkL family protein n=1 Tax=Pseudoxanthomonas sp. GM95 TaxID=1881043 RepID=UPI0008D74345|nr:OmpW family outer membrane protein [Pseudoxanthomonas sp. GM95]SEL71405.1 outer membrane protein [Pseudoxanthomonas sp. GM95]